MNLIDKMVEYCAENELIDINVAKKLQQMGLIKSLPCMFDEYDDEYDYGLYECTFDNDIEDDLDMMEEVLAQCNAKSRRRTRGGMHSKTCPRKEKLTAAF